MDDIIDITGNKDYQAVYCKMLESSFIRNNGNGKFDLIPLPQQAQIAPLFGLLVEDINADGNLDLMGVGNSYAHEIVYGRYDAMKGVTFLGDGKGHFQLYEQCKLRLFCRWRCERQLPGWKHQRDPRIIVTQNNDSLRSFMMTNSLIRSRIKVDRMKRMPKSF